LLNVKLIIMDFMLRNV